MDTDAYYWIPTEPPFKLKRPANERIELMKNDINKSANVVISGSLADWGDELIPCFTLAVRIEMKQSVRMERLLKREQAIYGSRIEPGGDMYRQHVEFLNGQNPTTAAVRKSEARQDMISGRKSFRAGFCIWTVKPKLMKNSKRCRKRSAFLKKELDNCRLLR